MRPTHLFLASFCIVSAFASDCQVSPWTVWSECFGNCETALQVRNRDVVVPPLPSAGHRGTFIPCPYLYETKPCKPSSCNQVDDVPDMPTPGPFPMANQMNHNSVLDSKESKPVLARKWLSSPEKVSFASRTHSEEDSGTVKTHEPSEELVRLTTTQATVESKSVKKEPEYYINSLTLDLPMKARITPDVEKRLRGRFHIDKIKYKNFEATTIEPELNEVFRHLERAAELNLPVDEKQIRDALKKNKKLVKSLVEAYRARKGNKWTATSTVSSSEQKKAAHTESPATEVTGTTTMEPTSTSVIPTSSTEATTTPKFWPRTGYVPNTRKHASDITSKLYMTKEIFQVLNEDPKKKVKSLPKEECPENSRCCRVNRDVCGNGAEPVSVKRYYRPKGSSKCVAYNYPRCSQATEMEEQPINFIQNCQDLCFTTAEKRISPLYIVDEDY